MDYPCAKFGYFIFVRFGFIVRTDQQSRVCTVVHYAVLKAIS